jgi:hypothetical protein
LNGRWPSPAVPAASRESTWLSSTFLALGTRFDRDCLVHGFVYIAVGRDTITLRRPRVACAHARMRWTFFAQLWKLPRSETRVECKRSAENPVQLDTPSDADLAKISKRVAITACGSGGTGRHTILRGWRRKAWGFKSPLPHQDSRLRLYNKVFAVEDQTITAGPTISS